MNKEHKFNMFTPGFIRQIERVLKSFEIDEETKFVILRNKKSEVFSFGTNLNCIFGFLTKIFKI